MTNEKELAQLLAQADITEEERQAWAKLVPFMSEEQREDLASSLHNQNQQLASLRLQYTQKMREIVDDQKADEARSALAS